MTEIAEIKLDSDTLRVIEEGAGKEAVKKIEHLDFLYGRVRGYEKGHVIVTWSSLGKFCFPFIRDKNIRIGADLRDY